jgi:hypothetical protein
MHSIQRTQCCVFIPLPIIGLSLAAKECFKGKTKRNFMPISGTVVRSCRKIPHLKATIPRFISPEEIVPGIPVWFVKMRSAGSNGPTKTERGQQSRGITYS